MRMLAVGGGSGGHVTPVLAVIKSLYGRDKSLQVRFLTDRAFGEQARGIMKQSPVPVRVTVIPAGKLRRYKNVSTLQHLTLPHIIWPNIRDGFRIIAGFFASFWILLLHRPDVVFAKGGYVSLPVGMVAHWLRIPLVIHDSDMRAGLTNRVLGRFADVIATGAPLEYYSYDDARAQYVGVPVDERFAPVSAKQTAEYKQELGFDVEKPLVVAVGGGLGAEPINDACVRACETLVSHGVQLYVVTGKKHFETVVQELPKSDICKAVPFVYKDMHKVLGAADVVVSRTSATFMQELAALKKPVVAVPSKHLGDQQQNAKVYEKAGAVLLSSDDSVADTMRMLPDMLRDTAKLADYARKLHEFYKPQAADDTAKIIYTIQERTNK